MEHYQKPTGDIENDELKPQDQDQEQDQDTMDLEGTDPKKEAPKTDDNGESSSTGSDGGKGGGSGSGGGYSADCSSSDASSMEAKGNSPAKEMAGLNIDGDTKRESSSKSKDSTTVKNSKGPPSKSKKAGRVQPDQADSSHSASISQDQSLSDSGVAEGSLKPSFSLPQWNGIRIQHPMDPRIDLSTVGHIQTSSLSAFPHSVDMPPHHSALQDTGDGQQNPSESAQPAPLPPSIDQYMKLMEVVRPFFLAHGLSQGFSQPRSDEQTNERPSSDFATEPSDSDQKRSSDERKFDVPVASWNTTQPAGSSNAKQNNGHHESDSSSMVVLARVKRKHTKKAAGETANEGSNNSTNDGSNASFSTGHQDRIQHQQKSEAESYQNEESPTNEDDSNDNSVGAEPADQQVVDAARQESTSASSSEDQNIPDAPQAAPVRYGVPAVVSEYSSSARAGSSGASNNNLLSTSGSGSGGNTGSGTASGSNQGGSSGSGNDQGGISSHGNGSSGSGNDVKGSSEETMDNSGENNSGENSGGNSDATNSKQEKAKTAASAPADGSHVSSSHRNTANVAEPTNRDPASPGSNVAFGDGNHNAVREKKLQDKKRKRMNMRREYEEKVQQEMESSEGSHNRGEILIKPGRPVTLDKVLSFTKIPRIVIKAGPPFLVVYTNAAYCRLSGIDSHAAVGKPISTLLSIPSQDALMEVNEEMPPPQNANIPVAKDAEQDSFEPNIEPQPQNHVGDGVANLNHAAAEAAGRARAAASQEHQSDVCLESLIAASGFGRCHLINVLSKPHHMQGRNIEVRAPSSAAIQMRNREEGSNNGSSISSNCEVPFQHVTCRMSISPVVSSPEAFNVAVVTDKDQENPNHKAKRRKHHHFGETQPTGLSHHQHRRNFLMREVSVHRKRHLITHYVIQLEHSEGGSKKMFNLESHSSTSTTVEAHILGLTKAELRRQRMRTGPVTAHTDGTSRPHDEEDDDEIMESESSEPREPVTAIG